MSDVAFEYKISFDEKHVIVRRKIGSYGGWEEWLQCVSPHQAEKIYSLLVSPSLALDQQYEQRLRIAEAQLVHHVAQERKEHVLNLRLTDALRRAKSAIEQAIYSEDGLDGDDGEYVLEYIRQTADLDNVLEATQD